MSETVNAEPGHPPWASLFWRRWGAPILCWLAVVLRYGPTAGRYLTADEWFMLSATHAISAGGRVYSDWHFYYPPVMFYLGAIFFKLPLSLFHSLLFCRLMVFSFSLVLVWLVFDLFRRLNRTLFLIPVTLFVLFITQFDFLIMEYRMDQFLGMLIVLQYYILYGMIQSDRHHFGKTLSILTIGVITFHANQKAVPIEFGPLLALGLMHYKKLWGHVVSHWKGAAAVVAVTAAVLVFSKGYHLFFNLCYLYPLKTNFRLYFTAKDVIDWMLFWNRPTFAFVLVGMAAIVVACWGALREKPLRLAFLFLLSAMGLLYVTFFPFLFYQIYLVWAVLFSLPFCIDWVCRRWPAYENRLFWGLLVLAIVNAVTFQHHFYSDIPLRPYADSIDKAHALVGEEPVASMGGSAIVLKRALPFCSEGAQFQFDEDYCQSKNIRGVLSDKSVKYLFLDGGSWRCFQTQLQPVDRVFVYSHYQKCAGVPLMMLSRWFEVRRGSQDADVALAADYRFKSFGGSVALDGLPLQSSAQRRLEAGRHRLSANASAVVLMEYDAPKAESEIFGRLKDVDAAFVPLQVNYQGLAELIGVLKYRVDNKPFGRFFWKVLSYMPEEMMIFHHSLSAEKVFLSSADVDPLDGWGQVRECGPGQLLSYDVALDERLHGVNVGWFYKTDPGKRLKTRNETACFIPWEAP